ncbi:MAG: hypothetical protein V4615_01995 [Bacteroidota bacterium]
MNPTLRNILAVIAGVIFGSIVNMSIIMSSGNIIPPPAGVDLTNMESLKTNMHLFQPKHFLLPFLAHALGTFAGALITALIAVSHQMKFAIGIGVWFLIGGIANVFMLPSPLWFTITDLALAYFPMAFLGGWLAARTKGTPA